MSQSKKIWARLKSIRNISAYLSVITAIAGGIISMFYKEFDLIPLLLLAVGFLGGDALVERLVMLSDIEDNVKNTSAAVQEIKKAVENVEMNVIADDTQILGIIQKIADQAKIKEVQILSSGLTTRQSLVAKLLERSIHVIALIQDPATALDKRDKHRVFDSLEWIDHHRDFIKSGLFDARFHINISTVRAIVVIEEFTDIKHMFVSWYYYQHKNTIVHGDANPTIYCTTLSKQGNEIYKWLDRIFKKDLKESRKITMKELEKLMRMK